MSSSVARNLPGDSSRRNASSIFANLSPRFEPKAIAAVWKGTFPPPEGWTAEINWAKRDLLSAFVESARDKDE